jgi:hypothetical protein
LFIAVRRLAACGAFIVASASSLAAQGYVLLPETRYFRGPVADPFLTRFSVALQSTDLLASAPTERDPFVLPDPEDSRKDVVAAVGVGGIIPLIRLREFSDGGVQLYADGKVFSRFRLEYASRDDMGQDWFIGGGLEARKGEWSGRAAITHRSSHIGDEFSEVTGAKRFEFGAEQLDVLSAIDVLPGARLYAGGTWIFRSYMSWTPRFSEIKDRAIVQLGADGEWAPWRNEQVHVYAGVDFQAAERTDWQSGLAAAAGIGLGGKRSFRLMARVYDGPSTMGEFFLTPERYYALELVTEF